MVARNGPCKVINRMCVCAVVASKRKSRVGYKSSKVKGMSNEGS